MFELDDLYQQVILDHNRNPRNYGILEPRDGDAEGHNPLCGDRYRVYLKMDGDRVADVSFEGEGCAISRSAASVMTEAIKGRTVEEIEELFRSFQDLVTGKSEGQDLQDGQEKLAVFAGVREFPIRIKCAVLAWHTLKAALGTKGATVTTE